MAVLVLNIRIAEDFNLNSPTCDIARIVTSALPAAPSYLTILDRERPSIAILPSLSLPFELSATLNMPTYRWVDSDSHEPRFDSFQHFLGNIFNWLKGVHILSSNSQAVPSRTTKQEQIEISHNQVPSF